jgi:DNA polymerase-3 subunit alpha
MKNKFVHLHVHTEYSLLDGLSKIPELFRYVKDNGMDSVAITDHGVMYGVIEFYKRALKEGVKPIVGMEAYTVKNDHTKKPERGKSKNNHLLLLAKNEEGYKNLMELTSIAYLEGYYYRPRFDRKILAKHSKGLIVTSACPQGELPQALVDDDYKEAKKIAKWFYDLFGDDYYLEVQRHEYEKYLKDIENDQIRNDIAKLSENNEKINKGIVKLSRELGIPLVATNDVHYIKQEDAEAQDALICIATGKNVSDVKRLRFIDVPSYYMTTPKEMEDLFSDLPDAVENTVKIADKCKLEISTLGKWYFPKIKLPNGVSADEQLKKLVFDRLPDRVGKADKAVTDRAEYELDIISKKGYSEYFIIVMEMVKWANEMGIITNTRGSAAGSLVSYALGITKVNPLQYYLPFERFLNPYRPSPPDIDLDIADDRREEMIEYISKKYGREKVAQICTFGRMLSRASVRDVARVLGYPYQTGDRIAKLIPPPKQGFPVNIPKALNDSQELANLYKTDNDAAKILDLAKQIEGGARHISVHAAGLVVSPTKLTDFTPIQKEPSGEKIITQYEMHACEDVGLIKFDILGIRNLSILGAAVDNVKVTSGNEVDLDDIPLDDKKTFEMLGRGETMGVFQLSSSGITKYLKELKPERVEDIMVMVALYRPGPISVIPEYIERKRNPKKVEYLDPRMERYLSASYGLIVYQDDLLFSAIDLAGYSWQEADKFRKAVGKKIPEEMAAQKDKFIKGIMENGQTKKFAEYLWELFEPFQAYGFNKAHAASYGIVAYQTAYMKANYPVEFMCALLTAESNDKDKVSAAVNECNRMGIKILPPDINESDIGFTISHVKDSLEGKAIRFGLGAIKNVGEAAIAAILIARKGGRFENFADFLARVDNRKVNKRVLESLIKVGALSNFGKRAALLNSMDEVRGKVTKGSRNSNQQGLFSSDEIKKSMKSDSMIINQDVEEFPDEELQKLEKQLLGYSLSAKPVGEIIEPISHMATHKITELEQEAMVNQIVKIAAVVADVRVIVTKTSGKEMAFVKVEDDTGSIELVVFPKIFSDTRDAWSDNATLLISGKVDSRDDSSSIIVEEISTKDKVDENNRLFVRIPKGVKANHLKKLKNLFLNNPGDKNVSLIFEGKTARKVDLNLKIDWTKKLSALIQDVLHAPGVED